MGLFKNVTKLGLGIATGGAVAAVVAALTAPDDPTSKRYQLRQHFRDARQAGKEAREAKRQQMINRYRKDVGDWDAFEDEIEITKTTSDAISAPGLGTNPPGAIAARVE